MMNFASFRLRPDQERTQGQAKPLPAWMEFISPSWREKARGTGLWLFYYIMEKSILVMVDPRPTVVPGEPGLLSLQS
jgi:hypothetical protein